MVRHLCNVSPPLLGRTRSGPVDLLLYFVLPSPLDCEGRVGNGGGRCPDSMPKVPVFHDVDDVVFPQPTSLLHIFNSITLKFKCITWKLTQTLLVLFIMPHVLFGPPFVNIIYRSSK